MKTIFASIILSLVILSPALACNGGGNCENAPGQLNAPGRLKGAPGPIAGAGLPILAIGYGVYWLVKRRRNIG